MKLRNKLAAITAAAMLAFAGVGFASWTFQNTVSTPEISVVDEVAVAVEMDSTFNLKAYPNNSYTEGTEITALYLICDAPTPGAGNNYLEGNGVYWSTSATGKDGSGNKLEITDLYLLGKLEYNAEDGVWPLTSVTVTFTVDNNLATNNYINFDNTLVIGDDVVITPVTDAAEVAYVLPLPAVSYTANALAISNVAGVTAMNTYLADALSGTRIIVSAQITDKAE